MMPTPSADGGDLTFDLRSDPMVIAGEMFPRLISDSRQLADGRTLTVEYSPDHLTLTRCDPPPP